MRLTIEFMSDLFAYHCAKMQSANNQLSRAASTHALKYDIRSPSEVRKDIRVLVKRGGSRAIVSIVRPDNSESVRRPVCQILIFYTCSVTGHQYALRIIQTSILNRVSTYNHRCRHFQSPRTFPSNFEVARLLS